ncbi:MAG TPA: hypothetical protein VGE26_10480 [Sphingobacteriaceae bacterium]
MNATQLEIAILIVCSLLLVIPLIKWLRKLFFTGPRLNVELLISEAPYQLEIPEQLMNGGVQQQTLPEPLLKIQPVRIIVSNHSEITAYSTRILFEKSFRGFKKVDTLDAFEPMRGREIRIVDAEYALNGSEVLPADLLNMKILIEYKNPFKSSFYTFYTHQDRRNKRLRIKPSGFSAPGR